MIYRQIAFLIMLIFYGIYIGKMLLLHHKGFVVDYLGKNNRVEIFVRIVTYCVIGAQLVSIILGKANLGYTGRGILLKVLGTYFGIIADGILLVAVIHMGNQWRVGIPDHEQNQCKSGEIPAVMEPQEASDENIKDKAIQPDTMESIKDKAIQPDTMESIVDKAIQPDTMESIKDKAIQPDTMESTKDKKICSATGKSTEGNPTKLVTKGIYTLSRNPAFIAFDLLHIGILLMYFNWVLFGITILAIVALHIQTLQEEKYLQETFGEEYQKYFNYTHRYIGFGRWTWAKFKCFVYGIAVIFSLLYYCTCVAYAGFSLSGVWIWLVVAFYGTIRFIMLFHKARCRDDGREKRYKINKVISILYHIAFFLFALFFFYIEANVVITMYKTPEENLDYVIVLGAGLRGEEPTKPLYLRIQKAYNYMMRNEDTMLIASGGQGSDEVISEAKAIRNTLMKMGLSEDRIILEDQSKDTRENLANSQKLIPEGASVGIVTNGFHLYRSEMIAKSLGYEHVSGIPAQTLFPVGIHYVVREFIGVTAIMLGID